jgi:hypothetical protein
MFRRNAFGMELDAMDGAVGVTQSHHQAVPCFCRDNQIGWYRIAFDDQRMIARRGYGRGKASKHAVAFVVHGIRFAMHGGGGTHDFAAEGVPYALMAKTDAQQRHALLMG